MAGYQLSQLQIEQQKLQVERARLEIKESRLLSAERLQELAKMQDFIDPAPERTVYLEPKNDKSLALNRQ
jgi:cell division protein FtsL